MNDYEFLYESIINFLIGLQIKRTIDRKIIKGFIENAKVKFIDDKLIELPMLGDHHTKIELHRECNTRSEGTSF